MIVPDFVGDLTGILGQELVFTGIVTVILTKALPLRLALPTGAVMFSVSHLIGAGWVGATIVDTVVTQLHLMAMYVVFAIVFVRSGSIWLSFGLHLGWDLTNDIVFGDGAMAEPAVHAYLVNMRAWDDVMGAVWAIAVVVCLVALRANYLAVRQQGGGSAAADPANTTAAQPTTPEAP